MNSKRPGLIFFVVAALTGLLGTVLVLWMTGTFGAGVGRDSITYVQAADNFFAGRGFVVLGKDGGLVPLTWFPPLYPFVLSWAGYVGMNVLEWARGLNAGLLALNIFLLGKIVFSMTRSRIAAWCIGAWALCSPAFIELHAQVLSEPLFLAFFLVGLWAFMGYERTSSRRYFYLLTAVCALLPLVRFIGIFMVPVVVFFLWRSQHARKWSALIVFVVAALTPISMWIVRDLVLSGGCAGRAWAFTMPGVERLTSAMNAISSFFFPASVPDGLRWVLAAGLFVLMGRLFKDVPKDLSERRIQIFGGCAVVYAGMLLIASMCAGDNIYLNERLMMPLYLVYMLWFVFFGRTFLVTARDRRVKVAVLVVLGSLLLLGGVRTIKLAGVFHAQGNGYASRAMDASLVTKAVRSLPDGVKVYSNNPWIIYYLTGRLAVNVPMRWEPVDGLPSAGTLKEDLCARRAVIVLWNTRSLAAHPVWEERISDIHLVEALRAGDDAVYVCR